MPLYVKYTHKILRGFEDYTVNVIKFKDIDSAKAEIENEYKEYINNSKSKKIIKKVYVNKK